MINKKGSVSIIIIMLLTFLGVLGVIIVQKKQNINLIFDKLSTENKLSQNMNTNYNQLNNHILNNSGSLKDMILCPTQIKYMSGTTILNSLTTTRVFESDYFCSGSINSESLKIYFDSSYSTFTGGILGSTGFTLNYNNPNFSGNINSHSVEFDYDLNDVSLYNDNLGKKEIRGKVDNNNYKMIFYINDEIREIINENTNNISNYTKKISTVSSGSLFLDINGTGSIKIVEFDKNNINKLIKKEIILEDDISYGSGNIKKNGSDLYLDFTNKDFAVFLKGYNSELNYNFSIKDISGSGVFILPIRDDLENIEYLNTDIIIEKNNYIKKSYLLK